ncbi:MAG: hypothetical protein IJH47_10435 [Oscillospiraceae bacterium]|nr:hypothetical protein [Oscillospiraceae bacterium]
MEEAKPRKKRRIWWLLVPAAVLILGALALILLLGNSGLSARYDNGDAIRAAYDAKSIPSVTIFPDGSGELRVDKEDLYWLGDTLGLADQIRQRLGKDPNVTAAGFRISEGRVVIYLGRQIWRLPTLSYRGEADLSLEDGALVLRTDRVRLGARLYPKERFWPELFREDIRLDLRAAGLEDEVTDARLEGNELVLSLRGLICPAEGELIPDRDVAAAMDFFGEYPGLAKECRTFFSRCGESLPTADVQRFAAGSGRAEEILAQALALCEPSSVPVLWEGADNLTRAMIWSPLITATGEFREGLEQFLSGEQSRYERLLFAVREMYRSGSLGIAAGGFFNTATMEAVRADTLAHLSASAAPLSISATDSRIVFLLSDADSSELSLGDMPPIKSVQTSSWKSLKDISRDDTVDLGVVLTTEGDVPVLLHRRADGTMAIRELTQEQLVAVLVAPGIPRVNMDTLPEPDREIQRPPGEGWSRTVILPLPKE